MQNCTLGDGTPITTGEGETVGTNTLNGVSYDTEGNVIEGQPVNLPPATEGAEYLTETLDPVVIYTESEVSPLPNFTSIVAGNLPGGLTYDPDTFTISGTLAALTAGAYLVQFKAVYDNSTSYDTFLIRVCPAVV